MAITPLAASIASIASLFSLTAEDLASAELSPAESDQLADQGGRPITHKHMFGALEQLAYDGALPTVEMVRAQVRAAA